VAIRQPTVQNASSCSGYLFAPNTQAEFFRRLYAVLEASGDPKRIQEHRAKLNFETVAGLFRLIEDDWSSALVIPVPEAQRWLDEVATMGPNRSRLRELQRYTVAVPRKACDAWERAGRVRRVGDTVAVLAEGFLSAYDARFGLQIERISEGLVDAESLVVG